MKINKTTAILFLLLAVIAITLLSFDISYFWHLRVDIYDQYLSHARSFLANLDFAHIGYNEYQPVAVMFFAALSPSLNIFGDTPLSYIYTVYVVNILLILAAAILIYRFTGSYTNVFVFALVLFSMGPIVLHRFELLVFLFVALGILFFVSKKYFLAGVMLGLSIAAKIYPILFIPYLFYLTIKSQNAKINTMRFFGGLAVAGLAVLVLYAGVFQASLPKIFEDLQVHSIKPVHAESVWGTSLTAFHLLKYNSIPHGNGAHGIFGIDDALILLPKWFYNYAWLPLVMIFFAIYFYKNRLYSKAELDVGMFSLVILLFLVVSKVLTAQYLLWFSLLFCLQKVPEQEGQQKLWSVDLFLILLAGVLSQFVYPLNYDAFQEFYYFYSWSFAPVVLVMAARNGVLALLLVKKMTEFFGYKLK